MDWELVSADFEPDGALRDIYIHNTTIADWQAVIDAVTRYVPTLEYRIAGKTVAPPTDISILLRAQADDLRCDLYVPMGKATLNCHFFTEDEVEFDLDPREMKPEYLTTLVDFLRLLGEATAKPVLLTMESMPEAVIMRFEPTTGEVEYVGPAFG
jgi:hypothetical protein